MDFSVTYSYTQETLGSVIYPFDVINIAAINSLIEFIAVMNYIETNTSHSLVAWNLAWNEMNLICISKDFIS